MKTLTLSTHRNFLVRCQADAQTDFIKLVAELGMTVPQSETRVAEIDAAVK